MASLSMRHSQRQSTSFALLERTPRRSPVQRRKADARYFSRLTLFHKFGSTFLGGVPAMLRRLVMAFLPSRGRSRLCANGKSNARTKDADDHDCRYSHGFPPELYEAKAREG
jgi:hypothetical protein